MFSYRHAFHAGNHADVLKHLVLIQCLRYLARKDTALAYIDTHAGAGLYRLDGDYAATSGEAGDGIARLLAAQRPALSDALQDYLALIEAFNTGGAVKIYPGSPALAHHLLRGQDRLTLCELHPTDARSLAGHSEQLAQLHAGGATMHLLREDGFTCLKKLLPPPARRALLLCDPSYEIKTDYQRVQALLAEGLQRFATGCYCIWHPIIARTEAHELPRRLKTLANKAGKPWLYATLTVKSGKHAHGLPASGMLVVNPVFGLKEALAQSLPQLVELLAQDKTAAFSLETAG